MELLEHQLLQLLRFLSYILSGGKNLSKRDKDMPGLAYYVVEVKNKEDLLGIAERANNRGAEVKWSSINELTVEDKDGILTRVRKNSNN